MAILIFLRKAESGNLGVVRLCNTCTNCTAGQGKNTKPSLEERPGAGIDEQVGVRARAEEFRIEVFGDRDWTWC